MIRYIPPMIISETHACMYMCVQVMEIELHNVYLIQIPTTLIKRSWTMVTH